MVVLLLHGAWFYRSGNIYDEIALQAVEPADTPIRPGDPPKTSKEAVICIGLEWDFRGEKLAILQAHVSSVTLWNASTRERSK